MKKNRGILLLFVFSLLALLIVLYFLLIPRLNEPGNSVSDTPAQSIVVTDCKTSEIIGFSYTAPSGQLLRFTYKDSTGMWLWAEDKDFPVNQTKAASAVEAMAAISASRVLEKGEISDADAGMEQPTATFSVTFTDGSERSFTIGAYNAFSQSYYLSDGSDSIYMIPSGLQTHFQSELLELAAEAVIPTTAVTAEDISGYEVSDALSSHHYDDPTLLEEFLYLYFYDVVDFKPDEAALAEYGLDSSATTITAHYKVTKSLNGQDSAISSTSGVTASYDMVLRVGVLSEDNDSQRYVMLDDSPLVYRMSAKTLNMLLAGAAPDADSAA